MTRLDPKTHPWLSASSVRAVTAALDAAEAGASRFVGGCVRNAVLGAPVDDIDIATKLEPPAVIEALEAVGLKAIPTGIEHGTVTAQAEGRSFEITTLRKDVETFGRRAVIAFTRDWAEDAARRDFRLNALYADLAGAIFDPMDGLADARAGRIVFIGDPKTRIEEDYLRILRFYRFNAWYGRAPIDPAGDAACAALRKGLRRLSGERIWKEVKKLLAAADPSAAIEAMRKSGIFEAMWPVRLDFDGLLSIINLERWAGRAPDPLLRTAALIGGDAQAVERVCDQVKASNAERGRMIAAAAPLKATPGLAAPERRGWLYRLGAEVFADQILLSAAFGAGDVAALETDLQAAQAWRTPDFPIAGRDLVALGYQPGLALGNMLSELEEAWVASDFRLDRTALLALAEAGLDGVGGPAPGGER